jgi:eukaryotic-like serine/threonine-protein kinase
MMDNPANEAWHAKTLVLMITDVSCFTNLVDVLGDHRALRIIQMHNSVLQGFLREHGGTMVDHTGDGVISSFEHASDAVGCARSVQQVFSRLGRDQPETALQLRIGIHAGEVLCNDEQLFGAALIATFRICALAQAGRTLLSHAVYTQLSPSQQRQTDAVGVKSLKGFAQSVRLYDLHTCNGHYTGIAASL